MRAVLINIGIILAIALAYYIDFFGWFTTKYAFWGSLVLVIAVLLAAFKVLGNPWHKEDDDDKMELEIWFYFFVRRFFCRVFQFGTCC